MNTKKFARGRQSCSREARLLWGGEARLLREGKVAPGEADVALGEEFARGRRCCSGEGKLLWGENLLGGRKVARGRHKMRE
ncbi:MAG: hypothetical protein KBC30_10860 [Planctomycetes bacterium]|nr:hypothetical protein [Planctomycetota bacterium]